MNNKLKKLIASGLILIMMSVNIVAPIAFAEEATPTPEQTQSTETTPAPEQTTSNETALPTPTEKPRRENESSKRRAEDKAREEAEAASQAAANPQTDPAQQQTTTTGQTENGSGDGAAIDTGDATTTGVINNTGNTNLAAGGGNGANGTSVTNSGNGEGSTNTGNSATTNTSNTDQTNSATVHNDMDLGATTGDNEASRNFGGAEIKTGDANVTGTIINSVNTNVEGVAVAEFNIVDDHVGDIILDFGDISCVAGCGTGNTAVANTGNGANSTNDASATSVDSSETFQNNEADLTNDMTLTAITGSNEANGNIGGDVSIDTGDANVSANVLNFANNNIAGNVIMGVVNIFGDLIGDILLPENPFVNCSACMASTSAKNSGNGEGSTNTANTDTFNYDNTNQFNNANIQNNLIIDSNTGGNETSGNIGGDKSIDTGNSNIEAQVLNIANMNISGGDWWLVIVNEAGEWIGRIMGAPEGANYAGAYGTEFVVGENGEITARNTGNLADSTNNANVSNTTTNTTTQSNNANIVNNINLAGNTGDNQANRNGSGDVSIKTGDVNIVANLVNFVNNNISGDGRLFVTVVNVFGSWMGDLVTPGQQKSVSQNSQNNAGATGSTSNSSSSTVQGTSGANVNIQAQAETVLAAISNNSNNTFTTGSVKGTNTKPQNDATVASVGQDDSAAVADKKITINLAWFLLLIPGMGFVLLAKKSFVPVSQLALRGIHMFL